MKQLCPYCGTPCRKEGDVYICPNCGRVIQEVNKEENGGDKSYIG